MHSRRPRRLRDIPVAGPVEVVWAKRRFFCDEFLPPRRTFAEETGQVPRRARSNRRLRDALVAAVIGSGRAAAEAASSFGVSWWLVQRALDSAALTLPDVDALAPGRAGRRDRPVSGIPQGPANVAPSHGSLGRRVPPGQARQGHAHRSPATAHPAGPRPPGTFHRPGLGQPAAAPARAAIHSRTGPGTCSAPCSPPGSYRLLAGQRTAPGTARHRVTRRRGRGERPPAESGRTSLAAGNEPSLAHDLPVVERNRSPHRHRCDNSESRSQQHSYQTHQTSGP
nr:hypothetical protein [Arthrobacter ramosus]